MLGNALVVGLALAFLLVGARPAWAQEPAGSFAVSGRVVEGTEGALLPEGLRVRVLAISARGSVGSWETTADAEGAFELTEIPAMDGVDYALGADYAGVPYIGRLDPPEPGGMASADVTIYETASLDPGIRFERSAWIVAGVDEERQTVSMLEVHTLLNPTDRTFVPGAGGPSGLLVFGLPVHATSLQAQVGLDPSQIVQIDQGFASLDPILPGRRQIVFSYEFPFSQSEYVLSRTIRYPVESIRVLAPTPGPSLRGDAWSFSGMVELGGRRYQELGAGPLEPGAVLAVSLEGLPARGGPVPVPPSGAVAVGGVAVGLLAVVAAYWAGRRIQAVVLDEDEETLDRLVVLERERAAGRLSERNYEAAHEELLSRLKSPAS